MTLPRSFALILLSLSLLSAKPPTDWEIYTPDQLPPGKPLTMDEVASLADTPIKETIYVYGDFIVTAAGFNRVVLRKDPPTKVRLLVEYPEGHAIPSEGSTVTRKPQQSFLVLRVFSHAGGTTILARECLLLEQ